MTSRRIHSVYRRVLSDFPWQGRPVTIRVAARRFRCPNPTCSRQTFAERLAGVTALSSRRTGRLHASYNDIWHWRLAVRLVRALRVGSRSRPARTRFSAWHRPVLSARQPDRPLGFWGSTTGHGRRGHRYGTLMVDLETNTVVDLLPDREAATVTAWLREHPGVEIVARDRASAYADGVRQGAPDAVQVADRWHLLRNLGDAVQSLTDKHGAAAGRAAQKVRAYLQASAATTPSPSATPVLPAPTRAERASIASRARRQSQYEEAARLRAAGASISRIAAELGTERKTVRRWLRLGHAPSWKLAIQAAACSTRSSIP